MERPKTREELHQVLRERTPRSGDLWKSSQDIVPGGLLSQARRFEPYPFYIERGQGPYIWDVDENRYIDCCLAFGVLFLGHRPPTVVEAIKAQLERGTTYGGPHALEIEFAEKFIECVPCAEQMLMCNSGTEATMQAIRIARAYTGRNRVAKFEGGYHGWHDYASWSINVKDETVMGPADRPNAVPESAGIPDQVKDTILVLPFEESAFTIIEEHASDLACVMIEPVLGGGTLPVSKEFLQKLREVTKRHGIMLMFDEVITGFRLALGGAQEFYGVEADIATYGKVIGGGLPVGAVGCSRQVMQSVINADFSVAVAGTFSGNPMTLAGGNAVLSYLMENRHLYGELAKKGDRLRNGFNEFARAKGLPSTMTGVGSLFQMHFREPPVVKPRDLLTEHAGPLHDFQMQLRLNGVFIHWLHLAFLSAAHSGEDVEEVLRAHQSAVEACFAANKDA